MARPHCSMPTASVVIPAHNEERGIAAVLRVLASSPGEYDIVVAANGCTDRTVEVAKSFPGVRVVEVPVASKVAALNAGDELATTFPRLYVDADIAVSLESVRAVVRSLADGAPAAAPVPVIDLAGCSPGVRAYFMFARELGYMRQHIIGAGFYGVSQAGRERFGRFPDLIADDSFVYTLFMDDERHNPPGATFGLRPPRTLSSLHRRHVRIALGNFQLAQHGHMLVPPGPGWTGVLLRRPWLVAAASVYLAVNGLARARAKVLLKAGRVTAWNRDETSRAVTPDVVRGRP